MKERIEEFNGDFYVDILLDDQDLKKLMRDDVRDDIIETEMRLGKNNLLIGIRYEGDEHEE